MTLRLVFTNPRMLVLAALLMACGQNGTSVETDAGDRRDGSLRGTADARAGETAPLADAALAKDAGSDRASPGAPDVRANETGSPDSAIPAADAGADRFMPVTPEAGTGDAWLGLVDAPQVVPPDALSVSDTRSLDVVAPDVREVGAETPFLRTDAADATRPIDQASSPDVPYGADGRAGLTDASQGGCVERPGVSCRVCNPVAPGAPTTFNVTDGIGQLIADPSACLVYGFGRSQPNQIVVFDAARKTVLARVALGGEAIDVSLSPGGTFLVAAMEYQKAIAVVDKTAWTARLVSTTELAKSIAVDDRGVAYYANGGSPSLRRINLTVGTSSDQGLGNVVQEQADLALSPDGTRLYWGQYGTSQSNLYLLDVTSDTPTVVSQTTWDDGSGFDLTSGTLFLGPSGKYVYYADHQFDASNLALVKGLAYDVYAEDSQARFLAVYYDFLDAKTLTQLVFRPCKAAAFISADTELWTYSISGGTITCINVADLTAGKTLDLREGPAGAIGGYRFRKIIADPVRPRLYGLDVEKRQVVSIDRATGTALRTVVVGSTPTDLEIDAAGTFIYTGHFDTYGIAQIDAASFTFVKIIPTPQDSYDIAPLGGNRMVSNNMNQSNEPALIDTGTGTVLDLLRWFSVSTHEGALFATADGKALFIGDSGGGGSEIRRYDVSGGEFVSGTTSYSGAGSGFGSPERRVVGTPDGTSIYYAGYCLDGTNLQIKRYKQPDPILSVTPNGKLAISETKVYRVSDGTALATLPSACLIQAVGPDSSAVYCAMPGPGRITSASLAGLQ